MTGAPPSARRRTMKDPPMKFAVDRLIFGPDDVDLARSPLADHFASETYVLGAFNSGMTRLPNGNLLMMVRVAEALRTPVFDGHVHCIRWAGDRYRLDAWPLDICDTADPRKFLMRGGQWRVMALTSLSWLLPVELTPDGLEVVHVHYDRVIAPQHDFQCYGIADARISRVRSEEPTSEIQSLMRIPFGLFCLK